MVVFQEISVQEVAKLQETQQKKPLPLIDVREPDEYAQVRARGSRNLPLSLLDTSSAAGQGLPQDEALYLMCRSGKRSARACEIFAVAGYTRLFNVEGGMLAWEAEGLPLG